MGWNMRSGRRRTRTGERSVEVGRKSPLALLLVLAAMLWAGAVGGQPASDDCLMCHGEQGLTGANAAGQEISIYVDPVLYSNSVHGGFSCVDCHSGVPVEHDPDLGAVSCATCHEDIDHEVRASDHGNGNHRLGAGACTMCHGDAHQILPASDPNSLMHKTKMPQQCATCHESKTPPPVAMGHPITAYALTVHGLAILERGNLDAASCTDCHGAHHITKAAKPDSPVNRFNIENTCGKCHGTVAEAYANSIHGVALARGVSESAACTDCHGEHTILAHTDPHSSVFATAISTETCARCHAAERLTSKLGIPDRRVESYQQSYHGLASEAGKTTVANCSSCHGVHDILPSSDPRSSTYQANLPGTCGKCHPGVSQATFTGLTVHAGPEDSVPIIRWVVLFYQIAIPVIIGGMLLHHALDFGRKFKRHVARERLTRSFLRWSGGERLEHLFLLVSFIALAYSGFAIKWPKEFWAAPFQWLGGEGFRGNFHRVFAAIFIILSFEHTIRVILKPRGRRLIAGLAFRINDIQHALGFMRGKVPSMHAQDPSGFSYVAKAEYWALVWGGVVMSVTGLLLVFQDWTLANLPSWVPDFATYVHYYEAVLATLAIIVWHFYSVIFDPDVYPLDTAMLSGKVHAAGHGAGHGSGHGAAKTPSGPNVPADSRPAEGAGRPGADGDGGAGSSPGAARETRAPSRHG